MSRQEFMERLNRLLSDIPVNERLNCTLCQGQIF